MELKSPDNQWTVRMDGANFIGKGSFAAVYNATRAGADPNDPLSDRYVAKVFGPGIPSPDISEGRALRNFEEERRAAEALRSGDGCISSFNCAVAAFSTGGRHAIIYRKGTDLDSLLKKKGVSSKWTGGDPVWLYEGRTASLATVQATNARLGADLQKQLVEGLLRMLATLANNNIVHLDIKPENILQMDDLSLVLSDVATVCRASPGQPGSALDAVPVCNNFSLRTTTFLLPTPLFLAWRSKKYQEIQTGSRSNTETLRWIDAFSIATCVYQIITGMFWNQTTTPPDEVWKFFPSVLGLTGTQVADIIRGILTAQTAQQALDQVEVVRRAAVPRPSSRGVRRPPSRAASRAEPEPPAPEEAAPEMEEVEEEEADAGSEEDAEVEEVEMAAAPVEVQEFDDMDEGEELEDDGEVSVSTFLPMYPFQIPDLPGDIRPYPSTTLEQVIFEKREFRQEMVPAVPQARLYPEQRLVAKYMGANTPYQGVLVYHEMGTGKTCLAGAVADSLRASGLYKRAVVLVSSESRKQDFENKLYEDCGGRASGMSRKEYLSFFQFHTYRSFSKLIHHGVKKGEASFLSQYEGTLFVVDEVHSMTGEMRTDTAANNGAKKLQVAYTNLLKLVRRLHLVKVVLLSGTPMTDVYTEMVSVLNLILPEQKNLTTEEFRQMLDEEGSPRLLRLLRGRVTYLRFPSDPSVMKEYVGEELEEGGLRVYHTQMSPLQTAALRAVENLPQQSVQMAEEASLFAFPNLQYPLTKDGFKTAFASFAKNPSREAMTTNLAQHSAKYAALIADLQANPHQNTFVYNNIVQTSGISTLRMVLEANGWTDVTNLRKNQAIPMTGRNFAVVTGTENKLTIKKLLDAYNSDDNRTGSTIRVLIGSKAFSEGYDLKNVQRVHVLTPFWNMTQIDQALGRAFRLNSHRAILERQPTVTVRIFLHVADPAPGSGVRGHDAYMYGIASAKDVEIKRVEHVCKIGAFDCQLTRARNVLPDQYDNTRMCQYRECDYHCYGITHPNSDILDDRSFVPLQADSAVATVKGLVIRLFSLNSRYVLSDIYQYVRAHTTALSGASITPVILRALREMIASLTPIVNRNGITLYLQERDRVYYLTDRITDDSSPLDAAYYDSVFTVERADLRTVVATRVLPEVVDGVLADINAVYSDASVDLEDREAAIVRKVMDQPEEVRQLFFDMAVKQIGGAQPKAGDRSIAASLLRAASVRVVNGKVIVAEKADAEAEGGVMALPATDENIQTVKGAVNQIYNAMSDDAKAAFKEHFNDGPVYGKQYTDIFTLASATPRIAHRDWGKDILSFHLGELQTLNRLYFGAEASPGGKPALAREIIAKMRAANLVVDYPKSKKELEAEAAKKSKKGGKK